MQSKIKEVKTPLSANFAAVSFIQKNIPTSWIGYYLGSLIRKNSRSLIVMTNHPVGWVVSHLYLKADQHSGLALN